MMRDNRVRHNLIEEAEARGSIEIRLGVKMVTFHRSVIRRLANALAAATIRRDREQYLEDMEFDSLFSRRR